MIGQPSELQPGIFRRDCATLKSLTDLFAQTPPEKQVGYVAFKSHSLPKVGNGFIICKGFADFLKTFSTSA